MNNPKDTTINKLDQIDEKLKLTDEELERKQLHSSCISFVREKYEYAKEARTTTEKNWLDSTIATRGEYSAEEKARMLIALQRNPNASQAFIKITKTKVQAAYGQLLEIMFAGNSFPVGVEATPVPEKVAEYAHIDLQGTTALSGVDPYGYSDDGQDIQPGATTQSMLGGLYKKYQEFIDKIKIGPSPDKVNMPQIHPAEEAAEKLEKVLQDQLLAGESRAAISKFLHEMCMLGSGVIKGPFSYDETVHQFIQDPETKKIKHKPYQKLTPKISFVSCWNYFPDPDATVVTDAEYGIERHKLSKSKLKELKRYKFFNSTSIDTLIYKGKPDYVKESWENEIRDNTNTIDTSCYEVLEYWGFIDRVVAEELGVDLKGADKGAELVQVNIWVCQDEVLRIVLNPFVPQRIPYFVVPYEEHLYQIWGIGVPENMKDTQAMMNGHLRMSVDNLKLAGSLVFEVNENYLVPGQDMTIYPGKIFRMQGGVPGQAVHSIQFPNLAPAHLQMFDKARQLADEATGIPSYSHGATGVSSTTRTAAGMSMLMSAAAQNIKTVVRNLDRFLLEPLGKSLFYWNMQFNQDNVEIRGDVDVVARGTTSLMKKEVMSQRLMQFLQITSANPALAPMVNIEYVLKQIASTMELDPEKVINSPQQAMIYAAIQAKANGNQQGTGQAAGNLQGPEGQGSPSEAIGGTDPSDPTGSGGGAIGTGNAPQPGEAGFTG